MTSRPVQPVGQLLYLYLTTYFKSTKMAYYLRGAVTRDVQGSQIIGQVISEENARKINRGNRCGKRERLPTTRCKSLTSTLDATIDALRNFNKLLEGINLPRLGAAEIESLIYSPTLTCLGLP